MTEWRITPPASAPARGGGWRITTPEPARMTPWRAGLSAAADAASLGFGDELNAAATALDAAARGEDLRAAYDRQVAQSRATLRQARQEQGGAALAGTVVGSLTPGLGWGGAIARGAGFAGRMARAAASGAAFGGVSGLGAGENLQERLTGGAIGAALGGASGAALHGALNEALPSAMPAIRRAIGLPAIPTRQGRAEQTLDRVTQLARQNEALGVRGPEDLGRVMQEAAARDPTLTTAEALGRPAINRVVAYSRMPGRTAQLAEDVLERSGDTFDELASRLDETLAPRAADGSRLSMRGANGELDAAFETASSEGYQAAFEHRLGAQNAQRLTAITRAHPEFYDRALAEARIIARGDGLENFDSPADPRFWHYVKVAAGDVIRSMRREGLGATRARQYTQSLRRLVDELDQVPGYRAAREQWGSLSEAREALDAGFAFDRMRPDDMQSLVSRLTPFQRRYLQAGVSERILDVLERRDNDGLTNIARELTNRRRGALLHAAFPERSGPLDEFLRYARTRRQMHADALRMASSSNAVTGIVGAENFPLSIGGATNRVTRESVARTLGRAWERARDIEGRILLTPVSRYQRAEGGLLALAKREAQRRQSRLRTARTRNAYLSGVAAAGVYGGTE